MRLFVTGTPPAGGLRNGRPGAGTPSNGDTLRGVRVLLQTTIPFAADDWSIERFSMLHRWLAECGHDVTSRNKDASLADIDRSGYDQIWLFAVDAGDGITEAECEADAVSRQRRAAGDP